MFFKSFKQHPTGESTFPALASVGFFALASLPWAIASCGSATNLAKSSDSADASASSASSSSSSDTVVCSALDASQYACPTDGSAEPTFAAQVSPIIVAYCLECHSPGGKGTIDTGRGGGGGPPPGGAYDANFPMNANFKNRTGAGGNHNNWDPSTSRDWSDFNNIVANHKDITRVIANCIMPVSYADQPDANDRITLLTWISCGTKNN